MNTLHFNNFHNGIGASEWEQNYFHTLRNVDVHTKPGTVTCSKASIKASATTVDAECTCKVTVPNGDTFFGASNGKIFKVSQSGTVSQVHLSSQANVYGIDYLNGYLYYASSTKLGRIALANASSESTWSSYNDTWATFSIGSIYKAMRKQNLSLFITDGNYIASVDNVGVFSPNVLDFESTQVSTAITKHGDYLLVGCSQGTVAEKAGLFLWDCFSPSWSTSDEINERGVNCFIDGDNTTFISIGVIGNIYYWDGARAAYFTQLRDAGNTVVTQICPYASSNLNGLPLFLTNRGIYSIGRMKVSLPIAQVIEYIQSPGQGITSGVLATVGNQVFSSWKNGSTYGIDKLDTNYANGVIITPIAIGKRDIGKIRYYDMPANCSISMRVNNDNSSFSSKTLIKDEENERCYFTETKLNNKSVLQLEVTLNAYSTSKPVIYDIEIS